MKKLYSTLTLAAAVAISASAGNFQLRSLESYKPAKAVKTQQIATAKGSKANLATSTPKLKANANQTIDGEWTFTLGDFYFESSTGEYTSTVTITTEDGLLYLESSDFNMLQAQFDATTGVIQFSKLNYGQQTIDNAKYYVTAEPYIYNYTTQDLDMQSFSATYNAEQGTITFPSDAGFAWIAYTDQALTKPAGYLDILDFVSATRAEAKAEPVWKAMGEATFLQHIMGGCFIKDYDPATATAYKVNIFYDENEPTTFMVEDPWKQFYAQQGWDGESPAMTIETANRDNVVIPLVSTGINGGTKDGVYGLMSYSYYSATAGSQTPAANKITMTVDANNLATITIPANGMLLFASTSGSVYYTTDETSTLTFTLPSDANSAISTVIADSNADAPVEFFNLQGVRVANPAAGQLVIKRQGDSVSKVVIR